MGAGEGFDQRDVAGFVVIFECCGSSTDFAVGKDEDGVRHLLGE